MPVCCVQGRIQSRPFFPLIDRATKLYFGIWYSLARQAVPCHAMPCHVYYEDTAVLCLFACIVLHFIALCGRCALWSGSQVSVVRMWHCKTTHTNEANKLEHEEEI